MSEKTSFRAKMNRPSAPKIVLDSPGMERFGKGRMLIATPKLIDEALRVVPEGFLLSLSELRQHLAGQHEADFTCPLTTGIFLRIVAEAGEEARSSGDLAAITPWWRVVRDDGTLIDKFPGKVALQSELLQKEGFRIEAKGRTKLRVKGFEGAFFKF